MIDDMNNQHASKTIIPGDTYARIAEEAAKEATETEEAEEAEEEVSQGL